MEAIIMRLTNSYTTYIDKSIVVIQVTSKEHNYNVTIDIESFNTVASFSILKSFSNGGKRFIYAIDKDGNQYPLHRIIAGANENEETVILNGDFTDLRLINLKKLPKGTGRLLESKERIARNIKPISEIINEIENNDSISKKEERDAGTSLSSQGNLDIAPSLFSNRVVVQFENQQYNFENFNEEEKVQFIELISSIKNSKTF